MPRRYCQGEQIVNAAWKLSFPDIAEMRDGKEWGPNFPDAATCNDDTGSAKISGSTCHCYWEAAGPPQCGEVANLPPPTDIPCSPYQKKTCGTTCVGNKRANEEPPPGGFKIESQKWRGACQVNLTQPVSPIENAADGSASVLCPSGLGICEVQCGLSDCLRLAVLCVDPSQECRLFRTQSASGAFDEETSPSIECTKYHTLVEGPREPNGFRPSSKCVPLSMMELQVGQTEPPKIPGCMDPAASNYDPMAVSRKAIAPPHGHRFAH